ncbi:DUF721 domain-containing protein [Aliikangiella sp. G2MR2-5]|uniref:DUF721 domain-containing protein n=1 Tax=Aliikangiella sp. G2MR2-5 TaxID=2788943 RepID=UPI0018AA8614|nr:DUF721 domain-containing protein [Aliikangiella sp. G2MR2-5]
MSRYSPKNLNNLISEPSDQIKSLLDQLAKIQTLNNTLQSKLNATLSKHCRVVNIRKSTLVIAVDSAAWANKLRFQLPELIDHFRQSGYFGLANIEVIVQPR